MLCFNASQRKILLYAVIFDIFIGLLYLIIELKVLTMFKIQRFVFFFIFFPSFAIAQELPVTSVKKMIDSISINSLTEHINKLQYAGGHWSRVTFTPGNDTAAHYIFHQFTKMNGLSRVERDTFTIGVATPPYNSKPQSNIIAVLKGKKDSTKEYVIGAHYDCSGIGMGSTLWNQTWSTMKVAGADDNASGVASVLELARILSDPSFGFQNDYTLKFVAFAAEEGMPAASTSVSHPGSTNYVQKAQARGNNILGMISIDMIGYNKTYFAQSVVSNGGLSDSLGNKFKSSNDAYNIGLLIDPLPFGTGTWSDHNSFWLKGIPAICLIEYAPPWKNGKYYTANPYYHKTSDTLETVNMELVKRVTQSVLAMLVSFGGTITDVPEYKPPSIASSFVLEQNFPNPFNPKTAISYKLSAISFISLKVFDLLGREISILVNEIQPSGKHTVKWNASGMPSGIYYYRLQVGQYSETKRCVLVR
jgi:hypothetical protein